jgi:hypothetical protein
LTDGNDPHLPPDEFRASLRHELKRAYRAESQFGGDRVGRARRIGVAIGLAAGAVFTLTLGLVLGASTSHASAESLGGRYRDTTANSGLAKITTPVRNAITAFSCAAQSKPEIIQAGIPVQSVSSASATSTTKLGGILGVRELSDGRVLVNDVAKRQVAVFDKGLGTVTIGLDSTPGSARSYGTRPSFIMRWGGGGDSTLFATVAAREALVLGADGKVAHGVALPTFDNGRLPFPVNFPTPIATDDKTHLFAKGPTDIRNGKTLSTVSIYRADLDTRQVETIGTIQQGSTTFRNDQTPGGGRIATSIVQAVPIVDAWTVLSDGTVAFVRGQDYHVDWLFPDGTKGGTTKLAFDWKRLSDDDKQKLIDSARVVRDSQVAIVNARNAARNTGSAGDPDDAGSGGAAGRGRGGGGGGANGQGGTVQRFEFVPPSEMPDFFPPIFSQSAMADVDGNLWILPTSSAQSQHGELVYDVVNPKRGLFERVRMPLGRSIAGFGKGGVIYLQVGDRVNGFTIERVTVAHVPPAK